MLLISHRLVKADSKRLHLELRVPCKRRGTLSFNRSRSSSWCPGSWDLWSIFVVCSDSTVRSRDHGPGRVDPYVYPRRPNWRPKDQDFAKEEPCAVAGGMMDPAGSNGVPSRGSCVRRRNANCISKVSWSKLHLPQSLAKQPSCLVVCSAACPSSYLTRSLTQSPPASAST